MKKTLKEVFEKSIGWVKKHPIKFTGGILGVVLLAFLSFFTEIGGYILTVLTIFAIFKYSKKISQERDGDFIEEYRTKKISREQFASCFIEEPHANKEEHEKK